MFQIKVKNLHSRKQTLKLKKIEKDFLVSQCCTMYHKIIKSILKKKQYVSIFLYIDIKTVVLTARPVGYPATFLTTEFLRMEKSNFTFRKRQIKL